MNLKILGVLDNNSYMRKEDQTKKPRGRPPEAEKIPHIPDTPENVARSIMFGTPKKDWDYLKKDKPKKD